MERRIFLLFFSNVIRDHEKVQMHESTRIANFYLPALKPHPKAMLRLIKREKLCEKVHYDKEYKFYIKIDIKVFIFSLLDIFVLNIYIFI